MTGSRAGRFVALAVGALFALVACSSSATSGEGADSVPPSASATPDAVPSLPVPTTSAAPVPTVVSSPAPSTEPASTAPPSGRPPTSAPATAAAPTSTCTKLTVRVIRGSASAGQEIAALQFVNDAATGCTLVGYPSVTLLLKGRPIGRPSQPSSTAPSRRTLAPGETAESQLHDYTNCQAPLSDSVRVVVPGSTITATRPAQLRACVVRVDALGAPE